MTNASITFWIAWLLGAAAWLAASSRLRGLTLRGAWWWAGAAWAALAVSQLLIQAAVDEAGEPPWAGALRYAAAAGVFCPVMSVLGAKRPQDRAWHFIVLSLWGMLLLPAAEVLILHPGQELEVRDARGWFLATLALVVSLHLLATRFWISGLAVGLGLSLLFAPQLPQVFRWEEWLAPSWLPAAGVAVLAAAMLLAWITPRRRCASQWDQLWQDFRDAYGLLWALRVAQRVNDAAETSGWPLELRWRGFTDEQGRPLSEPPEASRAGLETCLRGLLRRFVSTQWIDARLAPAPSSDHPQ